ncbi:hypothetical protein RGC40_02355 [Helicobacter pylori]|nr:hypothetical protein [Helicobacter pylori]MDU9786658.1 hypothetical protein [Helicobacter pylori]
MKFDGLLAKILVLDFSLGWYYRFDFIFLKEVLKSSDFILLSVNYKI